MHVPCDACGSSDAGWSFPDGGTYCYKCGDHKRPQGTTSNRAMPKSKKHTPLLEVTVKDVPARSLSLATCEKWGYGYSTATHQVGEIEAGDRVQVATYRDSSGYQVGQKIRTADKRFGIVGSLGSAGLYGQHLWKSGGKYLVITEGEIDAMSVSEVQDNKWPVVSVPNGAQGAKRAIQANLEWIEAFENVVFMFDMDDEGKKAANECALLLTPGKARIATLPMKDASDMLVANQRKAIVDAIFQSRAYRPDGLVFGDDLWGYISRPGAKPVCEWIEPGLQEKTLGIREGEVNVVVAGTGSGKSTFCAEQAYAALAAGVKVGYVALEEPVRRSVLGLLTPRFNKPMHLAHDEELQTPEVRAGVDWLKDRAVFYDHFGSTSAENLMAKLRHLIIGCECKLVVLDHLSIVVAGMDLNDDERRALDKAMHDLVSLAQGTRAAILVVVHLSRPQQGAAHEEGRAISLRDIRGSQGIQQHGYTIVGLERDQQNDDQRLANTVAVRVLKCRHTGNLGLAGEMYYDRPTGRMQPFKFDDVDSAPIEEPL